ncbi:MAG: tandem-95 repeat protein, partial [Sulfuricurvum sp.]|nr:tandem-95 repeat protein [Sulfuricurvum sp.]
FTGGKGNDILQGGYGNDTYHYDKQDGRDIIIDNGGIDTLEFGTGIGVNDLIVKTDGDNLIIALKEDGVMFEDLSDQITLQNWTTNSIERITFSNVNILTLNQIISLQSSNQDDRIIGTASNDIINGLEGDDILFGYAGNDTYIFGGGHDTIIDSGGIDTLEFGAGISVNDLILKQQGSDIIIGIKENNTAFENLTDTITLTEWYIKDRRVETISFNGESSLNTVDFFNDYLSGISEDIFISGTIGSDEITGLSGNDTIDGGRGNDILIGGLGDDTLLGGSDIVLEEDGLYHHYSPGADTLIGGLGNDVLDGGQGNDTYIFGVGDGHDTIIDRYRESNYFGVLSGGTIQFGTDISKNDLIVRQIGNDLVIGIKENGVLFENLHDTVTLKDWQYSQNSVDTIKLSDTDHTTIGMDELMSMIWTDGDDTATLPYGVNTNIDLKDGNDIVVVSGGTNVITGGKGNDTITSFNGFDTYIFDRGDGSDIIFDDYGTDTLRFAEGIGADQIIARSSGMDLIIALTENGVAFNDLSDKVTLKNWFNTYDNIENITLFNGDPIDFTYLSTPTEGDDTLVTGYDNDYLYGLGGNDILMTQGGNDTLIGGEGNDTLYGGYDNDTYIFKKGDGHDTIYDDGSNYSYYGGRGSIGDTYEDVIKFGDNITIDDIVVEIQGGDLLIGLKDNEKTFDQLSDTIRISGWAANYYQNAVETIRFSNEDVYNIAEYFNLLSYTQSQRAAPIVFDLNGNGVSSTSTDSNNVYFDYNADGLRERTGWIERGDALLAVDLNHDGIISNGSELFGDHTKLIDGSLASDGYAAMAQYDSNSDGKIDSSDAHFNDLLLWKDTNLDGRSNSDELSTLTANGIQSINLTANPIDVAENGNRITYQTGYTTAGGTGIVRDLWFTYNSSDTIVSSSGTTDETGSFSDSFDDFTTDTTRKIDSIESMVDSGITSLTLQSRYTGNFVDGASAQTVFEGVGYTGTLSNVWLKSDTLDTQYTYNGTLSDDVKALPSIEGQGNVINLQEAMNEKSDLAASVTEFQSLSETGNLADFEANIDSIIEGWALYDLAGESANSTPPIVLDLNGNGITSSALTNSSAYFDYNGDGRREHTAWIDAGDALLAIDLDGDGVITHGTEVFGNYTLKADGTYAIDGYDAMAQYDTNGDNVLDASDEKFSQLRLWSDANANGKNDAGELSTLSEKGISAINLSRTDGTTFTQITEAGNTITQETNYKGINGDGMVRDVWFSYDGTDTIAYSSLSDSDEKKIAIVENFYGRRLNSEERNSVEVIAEVLNQYNALRYDTIAKIITDKLYGEGFPNCQFLHDALNNTLGRVVGGVASTTETLLAVNLLAALLQRNHESVLKDLNPAYLLNDIIAPLLLKSDIEITYDNKVLIGHIGKQFFGNDSAENYDFSTLDGVSVYAGGGDDTIIGTNGIDVLVGGEGNDTLNGNGGNDVLEGGQGDDTLIGGASQNVYRYAWGDGNDMIIDAGSDANAPDTLRMSDLDISRISIERVGDDMIIHVCDEEGELLTPFDEAFGTITIKDGYTTGKIEHFYFQDTRYTLDEVLAYVPADTDYYFVQGDARVSIDEKGGEDTLHFGEGITKESIIARIVGNDLIIGLAQEGRTFEALSDRIMILNYTDAIEHFTFEDGSTMNLDSMIALAQAHLIVNGNDVSETLYGTAEGETFNAGAGDDTIYGEAGDDTYKFGLGEGSDTIIDTAGDDTILLKEGILASDVTLSLDGEDLLVSLSDGSRIRVVSWISTEGRIEHIKDAQGNSVDFSTVLKPAVENTMIEGNEDDLLEGSVNVTDISGTPLVYAITTNVQYGTFELDIASGEWIYEPNANFNGKDSVIISVTNGYGVTSNSTITLNVLSVNDAPTVDEENIVAVLRNTLNSEGQIVANDVDGDALSYSIETQAAHGVVSVDENGKWQYTAVSGYGGEDSAVISVNDGNGDSVQQTLTFTIIDNAAPEAPSEVSHTLQDIRILSGEVGASDIDSDILSYSVSTAASHGTLSVDENGTWSYEAADGYMGTDSAIITIDDNNGGVITQTLTFDVQVSAPALSDTTIDLLEDTLTSGMLHVLNPVGGALVYEVLNTSAKGGFAIDGNGNWEYSPSANLNGSDSVTIKVTNAYGLSTIVTLNLAIEAVNDAPILTEVPTPITLNAGSSSSGVIKASDVDGDTLSYTITTVPEHGTLSLNDQGEWSYTSEAYYAGESSATVTIDDGHGGSIDTVLNFTNLMTADWNYSYNGQSVTIKDTNGGEDTFYFTAGITANDIIVKVIGNDLILGIKESGKSFDELTVKITMTDWYDSMSRIENIAFSDGTLLNANDILALEITDGDDTIKAMEAAVTIDAKGGNDTVIGGAGNDFLDGNTGNDTLFGDVGDDYMLGWDGNDILHGGEGDDTLKGEADDDILYGDAGADYLDGGEGDDILNGGEGDDTLDGNTGNDTLFGDAGDDYMLGWDGDDTLYGGDGNDILKGENGNDTLDGGIGNDTLEGGIGIDTLIGGTGDDTYIVDTTTDTLIENANEGTDTVQSSVTYTLGSNLENLILTGSSAINATGNTLNNTLIGNSANNTLNGKAGADTMIGGDGNDLYYVDNVGDQVIETVTGGTGDTIVSTISWTLGDNIEVLRLSGNAAINGTGNTLNNSFYSGDGDNIIDGGAGNDNLSYGYSTSGVSVNLGITTAQDTIGSGMDTILNIENLIGSNYNDNFIGNSGANILRGGKGSDSLNGGTGNDTYSFYVGDGVDTIYDHDMNGSTNGGMDKITFASGITESSVAFYMNGNDLVVSYGGTDTVTITNQSVANNAIEKVSLSDGNYLTSNDINTIIQSMNSYASSHDIAITSIDSVKANQDLMNIVAAGWHK